MSTFRSLPVALFCVTVTVCGCAHRHAQIAADHPLSRPEPLAAQQSNEQVHSPAATASGWRPTHSSATIVQVVSEADALTLGDFEELALSGSPTLLELQAQVDAAEGRWTQVGLSPNPRAGVAAQEIGNDGAAGQFGAFASQRFVTANKLELNRAAGALEIEQAQQNLKAQRLRVLTDVRRRFYALLVAQQRVNVTKELHDIAQQAVDRARELVKEQEPRSVLTQAELEAELVGVLVENSRVQREAEWRQLLTVCGQPSRIMQRVAGDLTAQAPLVVWEEALERIQRESPELAAAVARVEQTHWALQRASVQATPDVTVQAGLYYDDGSRDPFASLQLSMPIPVFDSNQGGIAEAQANVLVARQAAQRVELNLQQRLAVVFQRYDQARRQIERYDSVILKKARENLDLNRLAFDDGASAYIPVLTAQRSYSQAKLARLNALEQLWSAAVEIEGLLLTGSLSTP